jgi:cytochrome b involved in lipid metabolism
MVYAAGSYTQAEVGKHNTTSDCWMSYKSKVYDISDYLRTHDTKYYFIDSWCGTDMTQAYDTKDNQGSNHKSSTTTGMLPGYYVGDIVAASAPTSTPLPTNSITETPVVTQGEVILPTVTPIPTVQNPYDFWTPFLVVGVLLWGNYFLSKTSLWKTNFKPLTYNMVWNTMLIVSLIPSLIFGLFMILVYSFPELRKINFDFMYWHVEGSICFSVIVLAHILLRLKMYFMQIKVSFTKPIASIPTASIPVTPQSPVI